MIRQSPSACWKRTSCADRARAGCSSVSAMRAPTVLAIVRVDEVEDRAADHLRRRPPEMALGRWREVGDASFRVDQQQCVGAVLDERAEPLLARAQRRFRLPALLLLGVQRQRMADRALERFDREVRLAEIVGGAGLHRLDRDLFGAAAGEHDRPACRRRAAGSRAAGSGRRARRASNRRTRRRMCCAANALERLRRTRRRSSSSASGQRVARAQELDHHLGVLDAHRRRRGGEAGRPSCVSGGRCRRSYFRAHGRIPRWRAWPAA